MLRVNFRDVAASLGALRLSGDERRAAQAERAAEKRIRAERDYVHHGEKIRAAADAARQRHVGGGPWGG